MENQSEPDPSQCLPELFSLSVMRKKGDIWGWHHPESKNFDTVTPDLDHSENCHIHDWLLFTVVDAKFTTDSKIFTHKQTLNNTFTSAVQLMPEIVCSSNKPFLNELR